MKFIETKREELRRERIALNKGEGQELTALLKGVGESLWVSLNQILGLGSLGFSHNGWIEGCWSPTITLAELKAKYFEPEQREPKVGDWGYFWNSNSDKAAHFSKLNGVTSHGNYRCQTDIYWSHFSHSIPPHIQEAMKTPEYEVVHSFGESSGQIVVEKEFEPGLYAGTRGGVPVILKRK